MDGIGLAALAVAVVTLGFVVKAEIREHRHAPQTYLWVDAFGTMADENRDVVAYIWDVSNRGTTDAIVRFVMPVDCDFKFDEENPPIKFLKAGEVKRLLVAPCDIGSAWVLLGYSPVHEQELVHFQWFAPEAEGDLAKAMDLPTTRWERLWLRVPLWIRKLLRPIGGDPVGPGGAVGTHIRYRNPTAGSKRFTKVLSIAERERGKSASSAQ